MNDSPIDRDSTVGAFQLAILVLTVVTLSAIVAEQFLPLPDSAKQVLNWVDTAICIVLFGDFCFRFYRAESKLAFMKWGWIDLLASIPNLEAFRWGRLVRVLRIIRLLRGIRSIQRVFQLVFRNRTEGGAVSIVLTAFLLVVSSSVSILLCERDAAGTAANQDSRILTAEDALWWSMSTITTVGYGDKVPATHEGRILGMVLMTGGVGLFGALSGLVASLFLGGQRKRSPESEEILARLAALQTKLDAIDKESSAVTG